MKGPAYYNEKDPKMAAWLRELIKQGHIAPGVVDERSIEDITPADLAGYTQCHFFAGIGVWSYALRRAGWPDDRPVWTGSCPCQPFSAAGKGNGFADERHLWPHWFHLITTAKPKAVPVLGEQVASKDGLTWLDLVQTDMEAAGYAFGAVDLCAAGVGAPHIRQRSWFVAERVAHAGREGLSEQRGQWDESEGFTETDLACGLADGNDDRQQSSVDQRGRGRQSEAGNDTRGCGTACGVADAPSERRNGGEDTPKQTGRDRFKNSGAPRGADRPGPTNGLWADADWLYCCDGMCRPVEPGTFPLVDGAPARVGRLRGYGNAINAEVAATFIEAVIESGVGVDS